jgi:hypothetical protein
MKGPPEAVETDHALTCQSLKTLVFRRYRFSVEMLYQEKSSKIHEEGLLGRKFGREANRIDLTNLNTP